MPWSVTHNSFRLRHSELSVWAGINGHRKSMIVGQIMGWIAKHQRVCIASLEMQPETTLLRMARQLCGCMPTDGWMHKFMDWSDERICLYDQLDTIEVERILGMVHYAAVELKCDHIVIDSLTKCGLPPDDYNAQTKFVDRLQWAAKAHKCHIHLVAHMRKGRDVLDRPDKWDVKGSSHITDLADNVVIVWANKKREEARKEQSRGATLTKQQEQELERGVDQELIVAKQRHGEYEGSVGLYFDPKSLQFTSIEGKRIPVEL